MIETRLSHNYILKYDEKLLEPQFADDKDYGKLNIYPDIFVLDNPFDGETPSSYMTGIFYEWVYIFPKVFTFGSYLMIYVIPHHNLCDKDEQCIPRTLYSSTVFTRNEEIQKISLAFSDGYPLSCKSFDV